ncbi:MAG: carboxypeptidase-like regulatory domain-containing protein, partial [Bacteroidetes bacterium]|nr:carboxypeptidase-like regulatory domain-containing protein [Bacteroidota bacterium]
GTISDEQNKPVIGASVYLKGSSFGVVTNYKGQYIMNLPLGNQQLVIRSIGFVTDTVSITIQKGSNTLDATLKADVQQLSGITISQDDRELANSIMRQVLENRKKYINPFETFKCTTYIKAALEKETTETIKDSVTKEKTKEITKEQMNLIESLSETYYSAPNEFKDVKIAHLDHTDKPKSFNIDATVSAYGFYTGEYSAYQERGYYESSPWLFYINTADANFNFYENQIEIPRLADLPLISPCGNLAFATYKFKHVETFKEDDFNIHKIEVIPRNPKGPGFNGYLFIVDQLWCIKAVELEINSFNLNNYHLFHIIQNHNQVDEGKWVISRQRFQYELKEEEHILLGNTQANFFDYQLNFNIPDGTFNGEISEISEEALEKGAEFWAVNRPITLKTEEALFIKTQDSVRTYMESDEYLMSTDSSYNQTGISDILFGGIGYRNSVKGHTFYLLPIIAQIRPFAVTGYRHAIGGNYAKDFKNGKRLDVGGFVDYGFLSKDVKGSIDLGYRYNPLTFNKIIVGGGSQYTLVNPYLGVLANIVPGNQIIQDHVKAGFERELTNGVFINSVLQYSTQRSIGNLPIAEWLKVYNDSAFLNPELGGIFNASTFEPYDKLELKTKFEIRFKQKYIKRGNRKYIIGSDLPKLNVIWRWGIKSLFGSDIDYNLLEFILHDDFKVGAFGTSKYRIVTGSFIGTPVLREIDQRYFTGSDPWWFTNPMSSFQFLGSNLSTTQPYLELHYMHRFMGSICNRIPIIKMLRMQTMFGANSIFVQSEKLAHLEAYVGIEKNFRLFGETFKYGLYYNQAISNTNGLQQYWKFGFDFFNPITGKWSY